MEEELAKVAGFDNEKSRILAYSNANQHAKIKGVLDKVAGTEKVSGVVEGNFQPDTETERFTVVGLVTIGLGLMDRHRASEAGQDTIDIDRAIQSALSRMVSNPGDVTGKDAQELIALLISGRFSVKIQKINYEEIRDYINAETAVLESL